MRWLIIVSLALLLVVKRPGPAFAASPLTLDTLKNAEYTFTDFHLFGSTITPLRFRLNNGVFDLSNAERDALREQITAVNDGRISPPDFLTPSDASLETVAFGDIDGDGVDDAVVVISFSVLTGPSKDEVIPVFNRSGQPNKGASTFIGIRKQVTSVSIRNGSVVLGMIDQNQFGKREVVTFHLVNDRLEEVNGLPATGGPPRPIRALLVLSAGLIAVGSRLHRLSTPTE